MGLAVIKLDLGALDSALFLPEGYHVKAVQQNSFQTELALLIESDTLPKTEEGKELPEGYLLVTTSISPHAPSEFRKYTTEVKLHKRYEEEYSRANS